MPETKEQIALVALLIIIIIIIIIVNNRLFVSTNKKYGVYALLL